MGTPRLVWCADGNKSHSVMASGLGWLYGARLPAKGLADLPLYFADQDWKRPDRKKYMTCLATHRPNICTVLDWEREEQYREVISWVEEAAQYVSTAVLVVPKVAGIVGRIPRRVGNKDVWLAYSVPTRYGGTTVPVEEFYGRSVHLLGGSPQSQISCWESLQHFSSVESADGNMSKKMATQRCCYWTRLPTSRYGHWQPLARSVEKNAPDECLRRSLKNILDAWDRIGKR